MTQQTDLGIAGNIARAFIHSPLSPLLYLAMFGLGILGLMITPRQEDPEISVPVVDLLLEYPGASAEEVASLAIDPLERMMSEIPGIKHVYSASRRGGGIVTIEFDVGEQIGASLVKVNDKIESNLDQLPPGVNPPLVQAKGIDDVPVVALTLWSKDMDDGALRALGMDLLQILKQIPKTGDGFVVGGRREQVNIAIKPERLSGYRITLDQVANTIRAANDEQRTGYIERDKHNFVVYSGAFLEDAEQIERLVVGSHNGTPVYVRDVADVSARLEEPTQLVSFYTGPLFQGGAEAAGLPAVTVALAKKKGSNGVTVVNAVLDQVESLKGRLIPGNVQVTVTRNYGASAEEKVNGLVLKLFIVTVAVTLLVWFALGLRPAIVVFLIVPVVILITIFGAWAQGYSINRVSLFALIFAIGILVDDAIVVVENMYRRWLIKGDTDTETALDSVREVGNPTIIATFTVIAALLPMGFVSGMMGPYMQPIPSLASVAMFMSLIAAFAFTPWFAMRLRPSMAALKKAGEKEHRSEQRIGRFFDRVLVPLIKHKTLGWLTLLVIIGSFFASVALFYFERVAVKMLPYDNKAEFAVVIDMPEGSALTETASLTDRLARVVSTVDEVESLQGYVGTARPFDFNGMVRHYYLRSEPWEAAIQVQLVHKTQRARSSHQIALEVRERLVPLARKAGARITVAEVPPGPPVLQSVVAEVYGQNPVQRRQVASDITSVFDKLEQQGLLADVDNYMQQPYQILVFQVDVEKAVRRGVSVQTVNRQLSLAMGSGRLGDVKRQRFKEATWIVMEVPLGQRSELGNLLDLPVPTDSGGVVPLAELGRFVKEPQDDLILHKDLREVEYVVGDAVGRLAAPIYPMLAAQAMFDGYTLPNGTPLAPNYTAPPKDVLDVGVQWAGEWTVTYETFRDMGIAFGAALILIYILVVGQFGNFLLPAIIMTPIPLTLIGIVPGHWLLGAEFTATSMIGFIALAGIIVRNSILLVDFATEEVSKGKGVQEAVLEACRARTRPIVITALALIIDAWFILSDPIFQGMAVSLLFGVLVSTALTLIVIPLGCVSASDSIQACANARRQEQTDEDEQPA